MARIHRVTLGGRLVINLLRGALTLLLTLLISGLLPMLIQTYGWYDMAKKSGGLENLVEVVNDAPPCEFCLAAKALQEKTEPDPKAPSGGDRVEILQIYTAWDTPRFSPKDFLRSNKIVFKDGDLILPSSILLAPETPPPDWVV